MRKGGYTVGLPGRGFADSARTLVLSIAHLSIWGTRLLPIVPCLSIVAYAANSSPIAEVAKSAKHPLIHGSSPSGGFGCGPGHHNKPLQKYACAARFARVCYN